MSAPDHARGIDHVVLPARDLDAAVALYRRMGFQVGARNRHPWGTENHIVQLEGCFLELIGIGAGVEVPPHGPRRFSFGAHVRQNLAGEGMSMLALDSGDAVADAARFAAAGIGDFEPFHFERIGRTPDGSERKVAFSLAFAETAAGPGFFTCQHHYPQNFWNAAFRIHGNAATAIAGVSLIDQDALGWQTFLEAFCGRPADLSEDRIESVLDRGMITVMQPKAFDAVTGEPPPPPCRFAAVHLLTASLATTAALLAAAGIEHRRHAGRIVVPAAIAQGVVLTFEEA